MDKLDEYDILLGISIIGLIFIIICMIYGCFFYKNEFDEILATNNYKVIAHDVTSSKYGPSYVLTIQDNTTGKIISQQVDGTGYYTVLENNKIK